jgi:hypothetical protein
VTKKFDTAAGDLVALKGIDSTVGTGTLTAKGNGMVGLRGNFSVTLSGSRLLVIHDAVGDATVEITDHATRTRVAVLCEGGTVVLLPWRSERLVACAI